jgi:hypothetical protein
VVFGTDHDGSYEQTHHALHTHDIRDTWEESGSHEVGDAEADGGGASDGGGGGGADDGFHEGVAE